MNLHPQLAQDCHQLGDLPGGRLLLHRNASLPWFILVPESEALDLLDLPSAELAKVMEDCRRLSTFVKDYLGFDKVNFGALGNLVPQMHLHVIGRSSADACWPDPVWGNLQPGPAYSSERIQEWCAELVRDYGLCVAE